MRKDREQGWEVLGKLEIVEDGGGEESGRGKGRERGDGKEKG